MTATKNHGDERPSGTMNQNPLVSIIIPFHNTERFLQEAIDSVLTQSYTNWELLLVNDGATDQSPEIALRSARQYPTKVRVFAHEHGANCGVSASRNLGLHQARGDYVCFLDADDVFLPHKVERGCRILEENPEAAVVCGAFRYWYSWNGSDDDQDFLVTLGVAPERLYRPPALLIHNLRAGGRKPGTSSIMMRRDRISNDACEVSFIGLGDDQVFWAKLSLLVPVFVTNESLFKYRQHPDSLCATAIRNGVDIEAWYRFLDWLESYLTTEAIEDQNVWSALRHCQRNISYQSRLAPLKILYRRLFSLRSRYWMRDQWIKLRSR